MVKFKTTVNYKVRINCFLKKALYITILIFVLCIILMCIFSNAILSTILTAVEGLCISFIAGYIVYYLTDIVSKNIKQEKAYKRSLRTLTDIYFCMSKIIESLKALGGITEGNNLITKESLKPLATTTVPLDDLFLFTQRFDDGIKNDWGQENDYFNFKKDLNFYKNSILGDIKRLDIMFFNLPENLVNTLADIEHAGLYSSVLFAAYLNSMSPPCNENLCNSLYEYILLYRELSKYDFHKIEFECSRMPLDEISKYEETLKNNRIEVPKDERVLLSGASLIYNQRVNRIL